MWHANYGAWSISTRKCPGINFRKVGNYAKADNTVVETSYVSCEGKISVPVVKENKTGAADILEEKRNPSDLMKNLQFHNMQGCTFNISFKVNFAHNNQPVSHYSSVHTCVL